MQNRIIKERNDFMKKSLKKRKRIRNENRKLIEKYPFLTPIDFMGRKISKKLHKYDFTLLDEMPSGWRKTFGKLLAEDINQQLLRDGIDPNDYIVQQVKEKFGELRWYDYNGSKAIDKIINDYSHLSGNICCICGKPDVPMLSLSWISPFCEKCFSKLNYKNSYEEYVNDEEPSRMADKRRVKIWSQDDIKEIEYDISETATKIRKMWNKHHKKNKVQI
jgi:hypothetical protein